MGERLSSSPGMLYICLRIYFCCQTFNDPLIALQLSCVDQKAFRSYFILILLLLFIYLLWGGSGSLDFLTRLSLIVA